MRGRSDVLTVPSEEAMYDFLTALNVSGSCPELSCAGSGAAFLATLTDPDADHVHIIRADSSGQAHCCECSHEGGTCTEFRAEPWPTYPVSALVTEWPDMERVAAEDYIDAWWSSPEGVTE